MFRKSLIILLFGFTPVLSIGQDLALSPASVLPVSGCYLPNNSVIIITISNVLGAPFAGSIDISYSLNGGVPVSETVGPLIMPGGTTYIKSFIVPADLSACQVHTLDFVLTVPGDVNPANNTCSVSITSDCAAIPGIITAPDSVCVGINSGNMTVSGFNGNVEDWMSSLDTGATWIGNGNTATTQAYLNIDTLEQWWALMSSPFGYCPDDSTPIVTIDIVPQTIPGFLPLDFDICDNGNGGQIDLSGYMGNVLSWEISQDGAATWTTIVNTSDSLIYTNLLVTTMYQVLVQNDICPAVYSSPLTLTLIPGSDAGLIVGESLVCNFENDSSLEVNPAVGTAVDWAMSSDNGATWNVLGIPDSICPYSGLLGFTLFAVFVQEANCPLDTAFHSIVVLPLGTSAGADVSIYEEDSTQLQATGGSFFLWFPDFFISDPTVSDPYVWPLYTTTYSVQVTDINGCIDTASVIVTVLPDIKTITIPNLLTPNGDGFNDFLNIANLDSYPDNEIHIFNTYGQVIFEASPYNNDWYATYGGANLPNGTYYYILDLNDEAFAPNPYQGVITILGNE